MEASKTKLFSKDDLKKLIVPLLFEQALAITVGMADTVMISSSGEAAVSGVSLIDMFNNLIISVLAALATGGAVVTSQFLGAGKKEDACKSAKQLIVSSVCITIGISILVMVFCNGIISLFFGKIEADVFHNAVIYMMISALSFPFLALYNSCAALFRSMGNSQITLKVSVVENIINIGGNALGVYVLGLGVAGVAIPSLISRAVAFYTIVWEVPKGSGKIGIINQNTNVGWLPQIFGSKYLLSIVVAVVITIFMYVYLNYSKQGYEISVVGESENTAKYVGIKVEKVIIRTMLLSGALCGLVGLLLVGGINHTVTTTIAGGQGFTAVLVSWMSKFNPLTMVFSSFLIIFMDRGASEISTNFGLNHSYSDILTGIILFFIIGCEFFITYRLQFRKKAEKEEQ